MSLACYSAYVRISAGGSGNYTALTSVRASDIHRAKLLLQQLYGREALISQPIRIQSTAPNK